MITCLYSPDDLLTRPIEHTLELMSCRDLGLIIGCSRSIANLVKRGERDLDPAEARRLRQWLASRAGESSAQDMAGVCG